MHLTREELTNSFRRQAEILNPGGLLFHSFWYGEGEDIFSGLLSVYYTRETLTEILGDNFEIRTFEKYAEMEDGNSFYIVLKSKNI